MYFLVSHHSHHLHMSLTTVESVLELLQTLPAWPCLRASVLSGGFVNYVYRLHLADGSAAVLKWYPPYIAVYPDVAFDQSRYAVEKTCLQRFAAYQSGCVRTPQLLHYDDDRHYLIMEDAGAHTVTLLDGLHVNQSLSAVSAGCWLTFATDLKAFLDKLQAHPREAVLSNEPAWKVLNQFLTPDMQRKMTTYDLQEQLQPHVGDFQGFKQPDDGGILADGDLWPNSLLVDTTSWTFWLVDWEMARCSFEGSDIEQLLGNLWVIKQSSLFDSAAVLALMQQLQQVWFSGRDWRTSRGSESVSNFVRWAVMLAEEKQLGWSGVPADLVRRALQEVEELPEDWQ